jgi:hypothetical protein
MAVKQQPFRLRVNSYYVCYITDAFRREADSPCVCDVSCVVWFVCGSQPAWRVVSVHVLCQCVWIMSGVKCSCIKKLVVDVFVRKFFPWIIFAYHNPLIRKLTGLFKHTKVHIVKRATNTLFNNLQTLKEPKDQFQKSGIYKLTWETCDRSYIGQIGEQLKTRCAEHHIDTWTVQITKLLIIQFFPAPVSSSP